MWIQLAFGCLFTFFSLIVFATSTSQKSHFGNGEQNQPIFENYGATPHQQLNINSAEVLQVETDSVLKASYQWLFDLLMKDWIKNPANLRKAKKSFYPHLLDSRDQFPHPDTVEEVALPGQVGESLPVTGTLRYVKLFGRRYHYTVLKTAPREALIQVRVHFVNASEAEWTRFQTRLHKAAEIWNRTRPSIKQFDYRFDFDIERNQDKAHFSVDVKKSTRGPYDERWGRNWSSTTIAHEVGHMMGLGDEYETLTGNVGCIERSLMCLSYEGLPFPHHYYHILRRLVGYNKQSHEDELARDENPPYFDIDAIGQPLVVNE